MSRQCSAIVRVVSRRGYWLERALATGEQREYYTVDAERDPTSLC
jgi:hypothetical protein